MFHRLWQGERAQEIAQVVGERVQLKTYLVVGEAVAGKPCLVDGVLAFLDVLLRRAALIVKRHQPLGFPAEVIYAGRQRAVRRIESGCS